jgi:hypothetical protein
VLVANRVAAADALPAPTTNAIVVSLAAAKTSTGAPELIWAARVSEPP